MASFRPMATDPDDYDAEMEQAIAKYAAENPGTPEAERWQELSNQEKIRRVNAALPKPAATLASMATGSVPPSRAQQLERAIAEGRDLSEFITPPGEGARSPPSRGDMEASLTALQTQPGPGVRAPPARASGSPALPGDDLPDRPSPGQVFAPTRAPGRQTAGRAGEIAEELWARANSSAGMATPVNGPLIRPDAPAPAQDGAADLELAGPGAPPRTSDPTRPLTGAQGDNIMATLRGPVADIVSDASGVPRQAPPVPSGASPQSAGRGPPSSIPPEALDAARKVLGMSPLDSALQASANNRLIANLTRAGGVAIGRGTGPGYDALDEGADRPLAELQMREADAAKRAEMDPNSPQSRAVWAVVERILPDSGVPPEGRSAAQAQKLFPWMKEQMDAAAARAALDARAREGALNRQAKLDAARLKRGAGAGAGKILPGTEAARVGDLDAAVKMIDDLMVTRGQKVGPLSGVAQYLPGTDAAQYSDAADTAAQAVGYILEGGKLSDADLPRYRRMLPTAGDGDARARAKAENLKRALAAKRAGQLEAFGKSGYRVIDLLEKGEVPAGAPTPAAGAPGGGVRKQYSPSRNQTRLIYPDGRMEVRDGRI